MAYPNMMNEIQRVAKATEHELQCPQITINRLNYKRAPFSVLYIAPRDLDTDSLQISFFNDGVLIAWMGKNGRIPNIPVSPKYHYDNQVEFDDLIKTLQDFVKMWVLKLNSVPATAT